MFRPPNERRTLRDLDLHTRNPAMFNNLAARLRLFLHQEPRSGAKGHYLHANFSIRVRTHLREIGPEILGELLFSIRALM